MSKSCLKTRLNAGEVLVGTILSICSAEVAELMASIGFDWLWMDAEHGAIAPNDVLRLLQAVAGKTPCLVRVPMLDEAWIKKVLDAGATGIIVPQVSTADQAEAAVRFAHYPPRGTRGLGTARVNRYGMEMVDAVTRARDETIVVVQAETADAVTNIETIAKVPNLDAVIVGPYDLSASLGHPGEIDHPHVQKSIKRIAGVCRESAMRTGIFALNATGLKDSSEAGFTLLAAGVDTILLGTGATNLLSDLRKEVV